MRRIQSLLALLLLVAPAAAEDPGEAVRALLAEDLDAQMQRSPTWASSRGDHRFDHLLSDPSEKARDTWIAGAKARLEALKAIDDEKLSDADRVNAGLLAYQLRRRIDGARFKSWQTPITQMGGVHSSIAQLPQNLSFRTDKNYLDYLARLEAIPGFFKQHTKNMRAGLADGRTPPQEVMAGVPPQALFHAEARYEKAPEEHALFKPFKKRPENDPLAARAKEIIRLRVVPAFRELGIFLRDEYIPGCRRSTAALDLPDGKAFYNFALAGHTTTTLTADEIHKIGLGEVARIRGEMMKVIARSDFPGKESLQDEALFKAFVTYLRSNERFYHETAEALLAGYRDICKRADAGLPQLFGKLPRLTYGVREMERWLAPVNTTARYYSGSLKNGKPGYFVANTYRLDQRPKYEMIALALHEAVPGHHLQIALAQEMKNVPEWRTLLGYTSFVEGWALYSERLGLEIGGGEHGMYEDPYDDFGRLTYEMWRAMRLVVDTGLHSRAWPAEKAVQYMLDNSALTEVNIRKEVDRYIAWPGQATGYKIGELKIRELRARAEKNLGDTFDIRAFHDAVLAEGAIPLPVLETNIDLWILKQR